VFSVRDRNPNYALRIANYTLYTNLHVLFIIDKFFCVFIPLSPLFKLIELCQK